MAVALPEVLRRRRQQQLRLRQPVRLLRRLRLLLLRRRGLRRRLGREARQLHAHRLQLSWLDSGTREPSSRVPVCV